MKSKQVFSWLLTTVLTVVILLCSPSRMIGQGWVDVFYAPSGAGAQWQVSNIPTFVQGKSFPIFFSDEHITLFGILENENDFRHTFAGHSSRTFSPSVMLDNESMIVLANREIVLTGEKSIIAYKRMREGASRLREVWSLPISDEEGKPAVGAAIQTTSDGNLICLGSIQEEAGVNNGINDFFLTQISDDGEEIWSKVYPSAAHDIGVQVLEAERSYWVLKNVKPDPTATEQSVWLVRIRNNSNLIWERKLSDAAKAFDMVLTQSGHFVITGHQTNGDLFVLKIDDEGETVWRQDYPTPDRSMSGRAIIEDAQQNFVVVGQQQQNDESNTRAFIAKLSSSGRPIWEKVIKRDFDHHGFNDIALTPTGNYIVGGYAQATPTLSSGRMNTGSLLMKTDTFGIAVPGLITGKVFYDFDENCSYSDIEQSLEGWNIQAASDEHFFYGRTDAAGNYSIPVDVPEGDSVDYRVTVHLPNAYWQSCVNEVEVMLTYIDSSRVDFPLKALVECPFMQTQISSNRFRPCSSASVYVKYCNNGTVVAEDASITISIDEALEFVDATINATEVGDNIYNFPIGDLGIYECGTFAFDVNIPCEGVELGDVFCIEAMTSPNILCPVPDQDWTGALLQLNYTCDRDSIYYQIENIGTNDMDGPLNYVIIEDAVLRLQGSFDLEPAETTPPIGLPLNGSSYHFFAQQEPGAPGPPWLSLTTAGCLGENVPLLNQFPQYSGDPSTTTYCLEVVGSFDPNDKKAIPAGFSETNNILPNTDLDYTIRFQNTGTDTAFRVVILDTLPEELALASIIPGPSSHPYEFKFIGEGVLSFSFHNIELPDSNANLAASQGFVSFKIAQEENLPDGTHIENSAGIYFDFNPPIITNTAFHTVRSLIQIVSGSINVAAPELAVTIIPNPMKSGALIRLEGQTIPAPLTLQLFDVNGRMVRKVDGSSSSVWLERANLTTGMYFFTLSQNGIPQASGKLVVD